MLMKVMVGLVEVDSGDWVILFGVSVGYMEQDLMMEGFVILGDYVVSGFDLIEVYCVEMVVEGLKFDFFCLVEIVLGGEWCCVVFVKLMVEVFELMLLDELINYLDIEVVCWFENELVNMCVVYVLISYDCVFLWVFMCVMFWIDCGEVCCQEIGFDGFEVWCDKIWEEEDIVWYKMDCKIKVEVCWVVEGISVCCKCNMGCVCVL